MVDTGADVKFTVLRGGATTSTIHLGDLTSVTYKGAEMLAPYSATSRYSHYEQGLSDTTVVSAAVDPAGNWIKITCADSANGPSGGMIHYYVARKGENNIYMASLPTDVNASPGEGRFIAYLSRGVFTNLGLEEPSNISANVGAVEGSDVFYEASGVTKSKFYNTRRMIENAFHGVRGSGVGAWMNMGNREHSAGGPFFKDIDFQTTSNATELYNVLFSGHTQTEAYRPGLLGPYAMQFTDGSLPRVPDYSWMEGVGIAGWVAAAQRGAVAGRASGVTAGHEATVALASATGQYWGIANPTTGRYTIGGVQAGTYTETLYDNELAVGTRTVTISAGQTTGADITNTSFTPAAIFRIGTWDGTPKEFLNADRIATMHPQDPRMSDWVLPTFTVGTTPDGAWPLAQFKDVNNGRRIVFTLTAAQVQALTLRVGLTLAFASGRPNVTVNAGQSYAWSSAFQSPSAQPDSRGITRGTWRGNNVVHAFNIPAANLRAGVNTIDLSVISGETSTGFLSPSITYDAVDLVTTASLTNAPRVAGIAISPANSSVGPGGKRTFVAAARDQFQNAIAANVHWSAARGVIDETGLYTAPAGVGGDTIMATVGAVSASTTVSVLGSVPIVVTPAGAAPDPAYNRTAALSVVGNDDGGESNLTYTWSVVGTPPAGVSFSVNGTNAAKNTVATFGGAGDFNLLVTIRDVSGATTSSPVSVSVRDAAAWYKADSTGGGALADNSGGNNTAKLFGVDGSYSLAAGVGGSALRLAGGSAGGYASLPAGIVSGLNDFTVSAWVKPDAANAWARVFDFGSGPGVNMYLTARAGTAGNPVRFAITTGGAAGEQAVNGSALAIGAWTHVAVTLAGNTATIYVNGRAYATNTGVTLRPSSLGVTVNNFIGKSQYADPAFQGSIDDFRLYGRALSAAEVLTLAAPTVAAAAMASPAPVSGTGAALSVLGADATAGEAALTYTWGVVGTPPAPVTFGVNGTNAAKNSTATFARAGGYTVRVTIANPVSGQSTTSDVSVTVLSTVSAIVISPKPATVSAGGTRAFGVAGFDQFGQAMAGTQGVTWSVVGGGGTIDANGVYTAPTTAGTATVRATVGSGGISDTVQVTIVDVTPPTVTDARFEFETSQSVRLTFSEDVIASVDAADLVVVDLATGVRVPASQFVLSRSGGPGVATVATWSHDLSAEPLPDGNYRVTLAAGSVADPSGNALAADFTFDFFVLAGDANRDRRVDFSDLVALAQNYNQPSRTFSQGNFNYDGGVDFLDLVMLAQRYEGGLAAADALVAMATAPAGRVTMGTRPGTRQATATKPLGRPAPVRAPRTFASRSLGYTHGS